MPSSPRIPREMILQTALRMLIRDGYASINIKTVARELGCSTQPISWHFGNMEGFRTALTETAGQYVRHKLNVQEEDGLEALEKLGRIFVDLALDEPNLFRFICMGESGRHEKNGMSSWLDYEPNVRALEQLIQRYKLTPESADQYMQTMIIYIHGIACLIASGLIVEERETIYRMVHDTGNHLLHSLSMFREETDEDGLHAGFGCKE